MSAPARPARSPLVAAAVGLLLAVAVMAWAADRQPLARAGNLDIGHAELPALFLMHHRLEAGRAYLVQRRASTMRRSDQKQPGSKRTLLTFRLVPEQRESYLLLHKAHPVTFLLPIDALADWSYPLVHAFVASRHPDWPLPQLALHHLHVDRIYRGLYVQLALPHDPTKKQGGDGSVRTLLDVGETGIRRMSTRFEDGPGALMDRIILGQWPEQEPAPPEVRYLQRMREGAVAWSEQSFELQRTADGKVRLMPTWWSLGSLFAAAMGRPAADYADVRGAAWLLRPDPDGAEPSAGWDPDARDELLRAWKRYLPALAAGLVLDARARGLPAPTATELQAHLRTATLSGLPLSEVVR